MITKYKINDLVYDLITKKYYQVTSINIRKNGTYYIINSDTTTIIRQEKHIKKYLQILDKAEKRYLNDVIRPFKNKITYITKICYLNKEYLKFYLNDDYFILPYFKKGSMYKNMKTDKRYTLEELHLI